MERAKLLQARELAEEKKIKVDEKISQQEDLVIPSKIIEKFIDKAKYL